MKLPSPFGELGNIRMASGNLSNFTEPLNKHYPPPLQFEDQFLRVKTSLANIDSSSIKQENMPMAIS